MKFLLLLLIFTLHLNSCGKGSINIEIFSKDQINSSGLVTTSRSTIDFGLMGTGINRPDPVTIENNTGKTITIGTVNLSGSDSSEFNIASDNCSSQTIPNGSSCTITLESSPSADPGQKTSTLIVPITSSTDQLTVDVNMEVSSNTPPTAASDGSLSASSNSTTAIALNPATSNEGNPLSYTLEQAPSNGQLVDCMNLTGSSGSDDLTCNYIPNSDYTGSDTFTYRANDGLESNVTTYSLNISDQATITDYKSDITADVWVREILIDSSGNQYMLGQYRQNTSIFYIWKYDNNGDLDITFASDGRMEISPSSGQSYAAGMIFDSNEDIYVFGHVVPATTAHAAIWKIESSTGQLDTSFDGDGKWVTSYTAGTSGVVDMIIDSSNQLVMCLRYFLLFPTTGYSKRFDKLNLDGTDPGYSEVNIAFVSTSGSASFMIVEDASGDYYFKVNKRLYKYNSAGILDTGFGSSGYFQYTSLPTNHEYDMIIYNSKIYLVGNQGHVFSVNLDGSFNTNLDSDGTALYQLNYAGFTANSTISYNKIYPDNGGNLLLVGYVLGTLHTSTYAHVIITKINTSGVLDSNFGESGHLFKAAGDASNSYDEYNGGYAGNYESSSGTLFVGGRFNNGMMSWKVQ